MSQTNRRGRASVSASLSGSAALLVSVSLAVLVGWVAYVGRGVIIPAIVAGFLSFLIFTLKETIRRGPLIGRFLPDWLCYLFAFLMIGSALILLLEIVRVNVETVVAASPAYEARLRTLTQDGLQYLEKLGFVPRDFVGGVEGLRSSAISMINPVLSQVGAALRSATGNFLTIFLYTVFMLLERGRIFRKIGLLSVNERQRDAVAETISDIGAMVRQYITVKTFINLTTASISYGILRVVGIDFPGFWALLIFLLNYVPIIGPITANALPVMFALVQPDGGIQKAAVTLALLVGLEQTISTVVEPRLVGRSLNLSPLVILLSLSVWGGMWGFAGMLLAVPITVTIMIVLTQFESTRAIAILMSDNGDIAPIKHASPQAASGSETSQREETGNADYRDQSRKSDQPA